MTAPQRKKRPAGVVGRLAERGEEAMSRLVEEVGRHGKVTDVLHAASQAKGRLDDATRRGLAQMGLASLEELTDLRKQVKALERRLARLEGGSGKPAGGRAATTTKRSTGGAAPKRASSAGAKARAGEERAGESRS